MRYIVADDRPMRLEDIQSVAEAGIGPNAEGVGQFEPRVGAQRQPWE